MIKSVEAASPEKRCEVEAVLEPGGWLLLALAKEVVDTACKKKRGEKRYHMTWEFALQ